MPTADNSIYDTDTPEGAALYQASAGAWVALQPANGHVVIAETPPPLDLRSGEIVTIHDSKTGQSTRFEVLDSINMGGQPEVVRLILREAE